MHNLVSQLRADAGRKTLGQLIQEREAAACEIERLLALVADLQTRPKLASRQAQATDRLQPGPALLPEALYRLKDLCRIVGLSRSTIYHGVSMGTFPKPVRVSKRAVRWRGADIASWVASRET